MRLTSINNRLKSFIHYASTGWRKHIFIAFLSILTIIVIVQTLYINREVLQSYDWNIQVHYLLYAWLFFCIDLLIALWGWHTIVAKFTQFSNFRQSSKIVLHANLARRIPGTIWYIASRAVLYETHGIKKRIISMLGGLELILFVSSGIIISLLSLPFWEIPIEVFEQLIASKLIFGISISSIFLIHPSILSWMWKRFAPSSPQAKLTWNDALSWLLIYGLSWIVGGAVLFCVANMFKFASLNLLMTYVGIWTLAGTVSLVGAIVIPFIGLREVSLIILLVALFPFPVALIIGIVIRLIWLLGELIFALVSFKL